MNARFDLDGDGKPDTLPKWFINAILITAFTVSVIIAAVTLGYGATRLIIHGDPTYWPSGLASALLFGWTAVAIIEKMKGSGDD